MTALPRTILYVANAAKIGGGNRVFMDLMLNLDPARFTPVLVAPQQGPLVDWAAAENVPCVISRSDDWGGFRGLARRSVELAGLVRRFRASVVHAAAPMAYRALGVAGLMTGTRRVCHLGFPPEPGELQRSFVAGPDVVIGCYEGQADENRSQIQQIRPRCRVQGVSNGVDVKRFAPGPPSPAIAALRGNATTVVAILGHVSDVKGYPAFVEAAATVARAHPGAVFWAIGAETTQAGAQRAIELKAQELGIAERLRFLGFRDNVHEVLKGVDIVALPSLSEGFPLAVLESMAAGKAVIATPVGGVEEAIADGTTGLLVPPGRPDVLASAISRLIESPALRAELGATARATAVRRYSIDVFSGRVQSLYDELLDPRRPSRLIL